MRVLGILLGIASMSANTQLLPPLPARTLSDHDITIPTDLDSKPTVLIVGFTRASRPQTSAWSRKLADLKPGTVLHVAILEDVPGFVRRFVLRGMKSDIPTNMHDRFLVVVQQAVLWRSLCQLQDEDSACVLLIGSAGQLLWRGGGEVTGEALAELRSRIVDSEAGRQETPADLPQP